MDFSRWPLHPKIRFAHPGLFLVATLLCGSGLAAVADTPNIIPEGDFGDAQPTYVPWAGVDAKNCIHGLEGKQMSVDDSGGIGSRIPFAPSVAVGNLSGGGKNDLILADARGFFWYFRNTGTPQAPVFTQGEVIPIWLAQEPGQGGGAREEGVDNSVPRIQLLSFNGGPRLDIVAGVYSGKLFRVPNSGTALQPQFAPTKSRDQLLINTRKHGVLWCNYVAPFFTTAFSGGSLLDLIMGEGTYSANSIWLLHNTQSNDSPTFDEDHTTRLIPGMGKEQLSPCVLDWNNDGKPDVICGDRTGDILLYLNNSTDPAHPTFAPAVPLTIGGRTNWKGSVTLSVGDLSNNHLPNLLIGRSDGTVWYAVNTGTPGNPNFSTPAQPLKGTLPPDYHYIAPTKWSKGGAWGVAYEMLGLVNPKTEPGFAFPEGVTAKNALKFWVWPYKNKYFQRYYMPEESEGNEHIIECPARFPLKTNTNYRLSFWVLSPENTVSAFRYRFYTGGVRGEWRPADILGDVATSAQWSQVTKDFRLENAPSPSVKSYTFGFEFHFQGQAPFYLTDLELHEQPK